VFGVFTEGDIWEVASAKCGGYQKLQQAMDRGAVTKSMHKGVEYYHIGSLQSGTKESFTSGYKMSRKKNLTDDAFKTVQSTM
jgi:hypothetical protein